MLGEYVLYEEEPTPTPEVDKETPVYSVPSFPVESTVSDSATVYDVRQVYDVETKEWIDDFTSNLSNFQNNLYVDVVGIQNNLTVINNSIASLHIDVSDNANQIKLMQDQLTELQSINNYLIMFYSLFLIEWVIKHIKSWRIKSSSNARR